MAVDYPRHLLLAWGGVLREINAGDEIWSNTLRCFPGSTGGPASMPATGFDYQTACDAVATALGTWYNAAGSGMAGGASLEWVKLNAIGADGKYENPDTTFVHEFGTPVLGGATQVVPSYLSICFSWATEAARGKAHHGRIYPPNYTYNVLGSAITTDDCLLALTAAGNLLTAVAIDTGLSGGVLSPAIVSPVGAAWRYITGIRVGNVYDRQSRRRNAVPEAYVGAAWPS